MEFAAQAPALDAAAVRPTIAVPTRSVLAAVLGLPLVLNAIAYGLGSDVASWWAPWAMLAAGPFLAGLRLGRAGALIVAIVALLAGPAPLAGAAAGALVGELAARGWRPRAALPLALPAATLASSVLAGAWA